MSALYDAFGNRVCILKSNIIYSVMGKNPYPGKKWDNDIQIFKTEEEAIEYAKENKYQLINTYANGSKYYFKLPLSNGNIAADVKKSIEELAIADHRRVNLKSIVIEYQID